MPGFGCRKAKRLLQRRDPFIARGAYRKQVKEAAQIEKLSHLALHTAYAKSAIVQIGTLGRDQQYSESRAADVFQFAQVQQDPGMRGAKNGGESLGKQR
jgi:hypothetical protein